MDTDEALDYYLEVRTGNRRADLIAALREAARRRKEGPEATTAILMALREEEGLTYPELELASYDESSGSRISRATCERLIARRGT